MLKTPLQYYNVNSTGCTDNEGIMTSFMTGLEGPKLLSSFVTVSMETHLLIITSQPSLSLPAWVLLSHSHGKLNCLVKSQVIQGNFCLCSEPERGNILWTIQLSQLKGTSLHHHPAVESRAEASPKTDTRAVHSNLPGWRLRCKLTLNPECEKSFLAEQILGLWGYHTL